MKIIYYFTLYKKLTNSGMAPWETVVAINDIRKMSPKLQEEVYKVTKDEEPKITIEGVSYAELVRPEEEGGEGMEPIRALMMLDWLEKDYINAANYLATRKFHAPKAENSKETNEALDKLIANYQAQHPESEPIEYNNDEEVCKEGENIEIAESQETE